MAFNTNVGKQQFSATASQTDFDFNFAIFNDTDLRVYLTPSGNVADDTADILTLSSDYSVLINGTLGGTVELASGASLNDTVTIVRSLPLSRTTDYVTNGDLYADTLDADQDYQTYLAVDQNVRWERSLVLPESVGGVSLDLPAPVNDGYLKWNEDGTALEYDAVMTEIKTVYENIAGINTVADDIVNVNTVADDKANIDILASAIQTGSVGNVGGGSQFIGNSIIRGIQYMSQSTDENLTIVSGLNAFSVDSFTFEDGATLTIEDNAVYKVL